MTLETIGNRAEAEEVFREFYAGSIAYRNFVGADSTAWEDIPLTTKKNFYGVHPWQTILPRTSYRDIYAILRSSGATSADGSSRGFFWPQLKSRDREGTSFTQNALREAFGLDKRSTLAIVGLSLGSWAGGEQFSFALKGLALRSEFPFVVFSPGNQHQEIVELIEKCGAEFEQILIAVCPSAIFYLKKLAIRMGTPLPLDKITFLVTGEPFPESLRLDVERDSKVTPALLSVYGSADTGMIGFESAHLIRARQALITHPTAAQALGLSATVPNLYHAPPGQGFFERIDSELVITKWQGLPLVRYNLEDHVDFFSWRAICAALANAAPEWGALADAPYPNVIAVTGRSKGCLFLCGSNIFENMLRDVVTQSSLAKIGTGAFAVWTEVHDGQQTLGWQFELRPGEAPPGDLDFIHAECVEALGRAQPEFADDYARFYAPFEREGRKIFRFFFTPPGSLTEHSAFRNRVKSKIIFEHGPLT